MSVSSVKSWKVVAALLMALGVFVLPGPQAHAFGKKKPSGPSAEELLVADLFKVVNENQHEINVLRKELGLPKVGSPVVPHDPKKRPTSVQVAEYIRGQQKEIARLHKRMIENNEARRTSDAERKRIMDEAQDEAARLRKEENLQTTGMVEGRCSGIFDVAFSDQATVLGRKFWSTQCIDKKLTSLESLRSQLQGQGKVSVKAEHDYEMWNSIYSIISSYAGNLYTASRWFYPAYGVMSATGVASNPEMLVAPKNQAEGCDQAYRVNESGVVGDAVPGANLLDRYRLVAMCVSGCYTPDQQIRFSEGYLDIKDASTRRVSKIQALNPDSVLERPAFEEADVAAYTIDVVDSWQEILEIKTLSGKAIRVTPGHPLLDATGSMRRADQFARGDLLVEETGAPDPIESVVGSNYYGKVYNVRLTSEDPASNVIAAQGLLTGSVYFQNEGTSELNRALFRVNLPDALVE